LERANDAVRITIVDALPSHRPAVTMGGDGEGTDGQLLARFGRFGCSKVLNDDRKMRRMGLNALLIFLSTIFLSVLARPA
jgi:hypothetical protein